MGKSPELDSILGHGKYFPETVGLLESLAQEPTQKFRCSHGDDSPAVGLYEVPGGCVALPGLQTQLLCPQHVITNGSFEGMLLVADLSLGAEWSRRRSETPDYFIDYEPDSEQLVLVAATKESG